MKRFNLGVTAHVNQFKDLLTAYQNNEPVMYFDHRCEVIINPLLTPDEIKTMLSIKLLDSSNVIRMSTTPIETGFFSHRTRKLIFSHTWLKLQINFVNGKNKVINIDFDGESKPIENNHCRCNIL